MPPASIGPTSPPHLRAPDNPDNPSPPLSRPPLPSPPHPSPAQVPFAMGSLGFMTPFGISHMEAVLNGVTGLERGVPLMLRHRLQVLLRLGGRGEGALTGSGGACSKQCSMHTARRFGAGRLATGPFVQACGV